MVVSNDSPDTEMR